MYKADIIDIVRNYTQQLSTGKIPASQSNVAFQTNMIRIFQSLRDSHTAYIQPPPLSQSAAILPFSVLEVFLNPPNNSLSSTIKPTPTYVPHSVSLEAFPFQTLPNGSILPRYYDQPIEAYLRAGARTNYGSNRAARLANAVSALSMLLLPIDPLPTCPFVNITIRAPNG